jgi:predicted SAM-dependent methyltransferase
VASRLKNVRVPAPRKGGCLVDMKAPANGHAPVAAPAPSVPLKLNLGSGKSKMEGFLGVDAIKFDGVDVVTDLRKRWPWEDESVDEVYCIVPGQRVETPRGLVPIERVRIGDLVRGASGFVRVLATMRRPYSGPVLRLACAQGAPVVTVEHPIATPGGWLESDKLRKGQVVFSHAAEVYCAKSVDGRDVGVGIGAPSSANANSPGSVAVLQPSLAKVRHDARLLRLANQIGTDLPKEVDGLPETSLHEDGHGGLPSRSQRDAFLPRTWGSGLLHENHRAINYGGVSVGNRDVGLDLRAARDAQCYRPFSVDQAGKIGGLRGAELHEITVQHFVGDVYNLHTSDETFFVEGVLTHNCSHFAEHLDARERVHFYNELHRVLKVGAKCTLIVPDGRSGRAYGDLTHKWPPYWPFHFFYLSKAWRTDNAPHDDTRWNPDGLSCDFAVTWGHSLRPDLLVRSQEYQQYAMMNYVEAAQDCIATMVKQGPT